MWLTHRVWGSLGLLDTRALENDHPAQDNRHRQADSRGARWLPITDRYRPPGGAEHRGTGEGAGVGEKGKSRELELLRPCSPEKGQTRGFFWFPKHVDCFVFKVLQSN